MQARWVAHSKCRGGSKSAIVCAMKYRIEEHRMKRGWSQDHLAEIAGTTKGYVSQLETGKRQPSARTLRNLAEAFGVDVTEMIAPEGDDALRVIEHLSVFLKLSREDQGVIARSALGLLPDDAEP